MLLYFLRSTFVVSSLPFSFFLSYSPIYKHALFFYYSLGLLSFFSCFLHKTSSLPNEILYGPWRCCDPCSRYLSLCVSFRYTGGTIRAVCSVTKDVIWRFVVRVASGQYSSLPAILIKGWQTKDNILWSHKSSLYFELRGFPRSSRNAPVHKAEKTAIKIMGRGLNVLSRAKISRCCARCSHFFFNKSDVSSKATGIFQGWKSPGGKVYLVRKSHHAWQNPGRKWLAYCRPTEKSFAHERMFEKSVSHISFIKGMFYFTFVLFFAHNFSARTFRTAQYYDFSQYICKIQRISKLLSGFHAACAAMTVQAKCYLIWNETTVAKVSWRMFHSCHSVSLCVTWQRHAKWRRQCRNRFVCCSLRSANQLLLFSGPFRENLKLIPHLATALLGDGMLSLRQGGVGFVKGKVQELDYILELTRIRLSSGCVPSDKGWSHRTLVGYFINSYNSSFISFFLLFYTASTRK